MHTFTYLYALYIYTAVDILCVVPLGVYEVFRSYLFLTEDRQDTALWNWQMKQV